MVSVLGPDAASRFEAEGFVILRSFLDASETTELRQAVEAAAPLVERCNPLSLGPMRFASNLFRVSSALQRFLSSADVVELVAGVVGSDPWVRWDQAVWKLGGAPTFPWHQDNGYTGLPTTHLQMWIALTPMEQADGALTVAPGMHHTALPHRWDGSFAVTELDGVVTEMIEAQPGDVVLFSSLLPHSTTANRSGRTRLAYVAEFLPVDVPDHSVQPPHFVTARSGAPHGRWCDLTPGWTRRAAVGARSASVPPRAHTSGPMRRIGE